MPSAGDSPPLHIRLRERLRRMRRRLAAPVEEALRQELAEREAQVRRDLDAREEGWRAKVEGLSARVDAQSARLEQQSARLAELEALEKSNRVRREALETALVATASATLEAGRSPPRSGASPRVSVILPTRDRKDLVEGAVRSVLAQTFADWELLIVDDGSVDGTAEALAPYLADGRVRLFRMGGNGEGAARNRGLREARGELVAYLDSDNLLFPGFLAGMVRAFDERPDLEAAYGVLVADAPYFEGSPILWRPFDRERLMEGNTIDVGAFVHRRRLFEALGGFDEELTRLTDWDLILRYTERRSAVGVPVLATYYRTRVAGRMTDRAEHGPNWFRVRRKWLPHGSGPRVLYAIWHYPQVTETYLEAEIRALGRRGARIEVWSDGKVAVPYPAAVPVHRGSLAEAIDAFRPDLVHSHWLTSALDYEPVVAARGLPMTVRAHGFETTPEAIRAVLARPSVQRLYLFPHQLNGFGGDPRVRAVPAAFDTERFRPPHEKDPRLVVRTAAALPAKDLGFFLELAKRVPELRFVLAAATCTDMEHYPGELRALAARLGSPAELRLDLPLDEAAALVARAGLYVHTAVPPGEPGHSPIGMPISIAEAMATGAHVLVRDLPALRAYVGEAGTCYRDLDHATQLLEETLHWDEARWRAARTASVDRAFAAHADETTLAPVLDDWREIASRGSGGER
jgi:glycosyltransferase involved in cell wall biosynthesis